MEQIQEHHLQDIFRVESGVLLKINKFKKERYASTHYMPKAYLKRTKGLAGGQQAIRDVHVRGYVPSLYPAGTIFLDGYTIVPVEDPNDYTYELKFSGGMIGGSIKDYYKFAALVEKQLRSYLKE